MNINKAQGFSRSQKILLALYKLAGGTNKQVRFEDIAVEAFQNFPSDFQLRGYPQFPDTGDIIHKPLYSELKTAGYVLSGNKFFSLTPKGIDNCKKLLGILSESGSIIRHSNKLTAAQEKEIERIKNSEAFRLYAEGKKEEILNIDFYSYLGVTVRTGKNDFIGRMHTVEDAITSLRNKSKQLYETLNELHSYLLQKFNEDIAYITNERGGKR